MPQTIIQLVIACIAFSVLAASPCSAAFKEGTDYTVLSKPIPNAHNTVIKAFHYDCPFCYICDKKVDPVLRSKLPQGVAFRPLHLKTRGKFGDLATELFAVLLIKDKENGNQDPSSERSLFRKAKEAYYIAYHDKKERWDAGPDAFLQTGLDAAGMRKADFESAKDTPEVKALLKEWGDCAECADIHWVPSYIVNGKYLLSTKNSQSLDSMLQLINELLKA